MLIATWNVNSIRTRLAQVMDWLEEVKPDVLCLQETKVEDALFPNSEFEQKGYNVCFHGQKSYNGVALISHHPIKDLRVGLVGELPHSLAAKQLSNQARVLSALINEIRIVNLYVPNGSAVGSEKYIYKLEWLNCLKQYINAQALRDEPLCILGDFNIALEDKDIHTPQALSGGIMASEDERSALKSVLGNRLRDAFRIFESDTNHWSWWNYRSGAWNRDKGWRIDHIYLSEELANNSSSCEIHKQVRGNLQPSDHVPVLVDINWPPEDDQDDALEDLFI